jgi:hypothetical protein
VYDPEVSNYEEVDIGAGKASCCKACLKCVNRVSRY